MQFPSVEPHQRRAKTIAVALLLVATSAVFANTLQNGYVWDDFDILVDNPQTRDPGRLGEVLLSPDLTPPYYRPLTRASFVLDVELFGLNPAAGHAVSVVWHLAAVVLLFLWAAVLFRRTAPALAVALLWAVHPVGSEAVGFISVRTGTMAVALALATLLAFWRGVRQGGWFWPAVAGLAFLAALGSKEQAVVVLPLAALSLWAAPRLDETAPRGRTAWALVPLGLALVAYLAARIVALGGLFGAVPRVVGRDAVMGAGDAFLAAGWYAWRLIWPVDLNIVHDLGAAPVAPLVAAALALIAATVWAVRRPAPPLVFGVIWFWLAFAPTVQLVALPSAALAERQAYIMAVGLAFIVVHFALVTVAWRPGRATMAVVVTAVVAASLLLGARTIARNRDFRSNEALFTASLAVRPSPIAHLNLGNLAMRAGDLDAAARHWWAAVALDPNDADALNQLGVLAAQQGRFVAARALFVRALRAFPGHPIARDNLERVDGALGRGARQP